MITGSKTIKNQARPTIFYLDFLRCIAAFAVVAIHVLGPFRYLYGEIPDSQWFAATAINAMTRWAVPVFMMISGALLLSAQRPFNCEDYLTKRVAKVVIPFLGWSLIYAFAAGFMVNDVVTATWSMGETIRVIEHANKDPVWYHLWFFYDFIPLYFVIPFLMPVLKKAPPELIKLLMVTWMILYLMKWLKVESFLQQNLILYSGYLMLGWYLFNRNNSAQLKYWVIAGTGMLGINIFGSWLLAVETGQYSSFYMGYKTLNTVIIAGMLFVLAQTYAENIQGKLRVLISVIAKYSLGIYLLHPLLLIPVRNLDNGYYAWFASNWLAIPVITLVILLLSLLSTMLLVKIPLINRLVP